MRRESIQGGDPFAAISLMPLTIPGGQASSRCAAVLDLGDRQVEVGVVNRDYRLIPNLEARNVALDLLTRTGLPFDERRMLFDGKHYSQRWTIDGFEIEARPGDFVRLGLEVHNSYDGTIQFSLSFIAERLICGNGMVVDFLLGGFRFRHYGQNGDFHRELDQALDIVQRLGDQGPKLLACMRQMVECPIDRPKTQEIFHQLDLPKLYAAEIYQELEEDTEWGFYNACTRVLGRQETFRSETLNRQVSHYFFIERHA